MNEIEKMYENAGIEINPYCCNKSCREPTESCKDCNNYREIYNSFTAEKQLLLIQWLAETRPIHINLLLDKWTAESVTKYGIKYDTFEDALSGYINQIWQDLTEEDKQQIKEILND